MIEPYVTENIDRLLHKLHLNPAEVGRDLDLCHLLLNAGVDLFLKLPRLFMIGVAVIVLQEIVIVSDLSLADW